jgi:hypothetical protein
MKTLTSLTLAALAAALLAASPSAATTQRHQSKRPGAGVQATPGGIVKDATGGYYDPGRSIYIQAATASKAGIAVNSQAKPGGIVTDRTGGYYDPARSIYVPHTTSRQPTVPLSSHGFSWTDATVGAGAATGAIFALVGAALLTLRRRTLTA